MATEFFIVCDGCDKRHQTTQDEYPPASFVKVKVTVGAWGDDYDLCQQCHTYLLDKANPKKWPRMAKAAPKAA